VATGYIQTPIEPKEILILKNETREGPGLLGQLINELGISNKIIDLCKGEFPVNPENYAAIIVLGGPDSANDQTEKMTAELAFIRKILDLGIPYLGICLGLQVMVKAGGGQVIKSPVKEVGFRDGNGDLYSVELTQEGLHDALFDGLANTFTVFHLHGETVELNDDMSLLGTGKLCRNQIVRVGENAYGIQCHFELTEEMFELWITQDPDLMALDPEVLRKDFLELKDMYSDTGKKLFRGFLRIAGYNM
jgi:GMP synthase (glutamine-hydrolysing)